MPDTPELAAEASPVAHRVVVTITGEVDLYEYDDMDRGEATPEQVEGWERLCRQDIEDSLVGTLDRVDTVTYSPLTPPVDQAG